MEGSSSTERDTNPKCKEWDETTCPICLDHPHNAVLLVCSSHEKGCRSYICDSSYRHSNCLDRFKKLREELYQDDNNPSQPTSPYLEISSSERVAQGWSPITRQERSRNTEAQVNEELSLEEPIGGKITETNCLRCPLCRGAVLDWMVVREAREYLDLKPRGCAWDSCTFSGAYRELRRHARRDHPTIRPADVDPTRQRAWRQVERQQEHGDILSAIRAAMPGAVVLGDYVIDPTLHQVAPGAVVFGDYIMDGGDGAVAPRDWVMGSSDGPTWNNFLLFHVIRSPMRRAQRHRNLWGENLLGLHDDDDDDDDEDDDGWEIDDDMPMIARRHVGLATYGLLGEDDGLEMDDEEAVSMPRTRRRFTRSRSNDEQQGGGASW